MVYYTKGSNTACDVHWGVKQASHVQNSRFSLAIHNCRLWADSNIANEIHGFMIDYK